MAGNKITEKGDGAMMSINERIKEALSVLEIPVVPKVFQGDDERYIVFNYNTIPVDFADDGPEHERYLIQVHLFCPLGANSLSEMRKIKEALFEAGMTWPDVTDVSDKNGQHLVFECEIAEGTSYGET